MIMLGILAMAAVLWISEVIPLAVTGILIMVLQPLLTKMEPSQVFSNFGNKAVFFIIGSFMLATAIEKHGLHKRIALKILSWFGKGPKIFLFGTLFVGAMLSLIMQEHAVAILLLPVFMHILVSLRLTPKVSNFGIATMIALIFGTSIGSWGTLLGGARNPLTLGFLENLGYEITFLEWMKMALPMVFLALPFAWLVLITFFPPEIDDIEIARKEIEKDVTSMGAMGGEEKKILVIYISMVILWIFMSHQIGVAVIALIGVVLMFIFRVVDWIDVEKGVQWGIILLYGGAITMGIGLQETGAAEWLAHNILSTVGGNAYAALAALIIVGFLLTNLMSNTAAVAFLLPLGIGVSEAVGLSPLVTSFAIALSGGGAFMLIISTPGAAISYSSGYFSSKHLLKAGFVTSVICMCILFVIAVIYWQEFLGL
jgi:sodium-dependent dicarboxylate transporter 2/3/5